MVTSADIAPRKNIKSLFVVCEILKSKMVATVPPQLLPSVLKSAIVDFCSGINYLFLVIAGRSLE